MNEPRFSRLSRPVLALIGGSVLVVACYFFVDRPVAWFMHNHRLFPRELWRWLPLVSDWLSYGVILAMIAVVAWWIWRPGGWRQKLLLAIAANLALTAAIKFALKGAFGRTWPENWTKNSPSLITNGAYGFHPFHFGNAYQSFPSRHAAATFAVVSILWLSVPRWRWPYAIAAGAVCVALVGMNYHFVGDVIAGALLGSTTGLCATRVFRLQPVDEANGRRS